MHFFLHHAVASSPFSVVHFGLGENERCAKDEEKSYLHLTEQARIIGTEIR